MAHVVVLLLVGVRCARLRLRHLVIHSLATSLHQAGCIAVQSVEGTAHVSAAGKAVAAAFQEYIRRPGALATYDTINHGGVWRLVTVRDSQRTGQVRCTCVCE